jgi:hypothetical protein
MIYKPLSTYPTCTSLSFEPKVSTRLHWYHGLNGFSGAGGGGIDMYHYKYPILQIHKIGISEFKFDISKVKYSQ